MPKQLFVLQGGEKRMQRSQRWFLPCTWGNTGGNNLPCEESHSDSTKQMLHRTLSQQQSLVGQQQSTVSTGGSKAVCKILVGVWRRYHECISGLETSKYSAGGEARADLTFLETGPKILQTIPSHKNASARNNFTRTLLH